ncbi:hypothetical protein CVT26_013909 [Gymnopilus dilepis]|uniref:NAD-dependent epimerase/dehydratase domain-containing protein n=1 Tax=Gymnopilus dilepis TaxID=231916 RepID=A0A409VW20_9AGAR|nr:hypothetical protein CVT26_013909 [Gymnopilus dilepis]
MPTVEPNRDTRILVTGGNGFIGMWVIRTLLEQGYSVRGAIRSLEKGMGLRDYFLNSNVEWVVVKDFYKDGGFDNAVKDVDAIIHMASPVTTDSEDPDAYIKPAVDGTLSLLKSAARVGKSVKRVVFTSSCAAVIGPVNKPNTIFNEDNWADESVRITEEKGKDAPDLTKYRASKTLAEKAAWKFYNEHKAEIGWDLVALNPSLPTLLDPKKPHQLNASLATWWKIITKKDVSDEELKQTYAFIDVRDIASAHVVALSKAEAGGERMIISNALTRPYATGAITWQETPTDTLAAGNIINSLQPKLYASGILPRGKPDLDKTISYDYDGSKGKRILGLKYRSKEETFSDTLADFEARRWLEKPVE